MLKTSTNIIFMVLNSENPVLKIYAFGEGQVQYPIPALPTFEAEARNIAPEILKSRRTKIVPIKYLHLF
jgi:hypothetical protein